MVLYFSGTGNSLYIAQRIAHCLGERLVAIADLVRTNQYTLTLEEGESIGFVYPVHACAPPDIVTSFIKKAEFRNYSKQYIYSVFNCAGTPEYTSRIMKETCEKRKMVLKGFFSVLMPGNLITVKKHLPVEKCKQYLEQADSNIDHIIDDIRHQVSNYQKEKHSFLLSYGVHKLASLEKTEKFTFGSGCVSCGKCAKICPMEAITMEEGKPVRNAKKCEFCLACINVCPTGALQIGKKTQGNPHYIHPKYNGKARDIVD